ncbi:MAG: hypothetical protein U1F30_08835 [Steroidobacteraceae bacterium]
METLERILADFAAHGAADGAAAADTLRALRGLPLARDENWRHANLRALQRVPGFAAAPAAAPQLPDAAAAPGAASLPEPLEGFERLVLRNGRAATAPCAMSAS